MLPVERLTVTRRGPGVGRGRAGTTVAPSSAFAAGLRAAQRKPDGVDLRKVERTTFSLETIDPEVVDLLSTSGARLGLDPRTLGVSYAMSECLSITSTKTGEGLRIDTVDLDASQRRAGGAGR